MLFISLWRDIIKALQGQSGQTVKGAFVVDFTNKNIGSSSLMLQIILRVLSSLISLKTKLSVVLSSASSLSVTCSSCFSVIKYGENMLTASTAMLTAVNKRQLNGEGEPLKSQQILSMFKLQCANRPQCKTCHQC